MLLAMKKENIITKMLVIRRLGRSICPNISDDCPMNGLNLFYHRSASGSSVCFTLKKYMIKRSLKGGKKIYNTQANGIVSFN